MGMATVITWAAAAADIITAGVGAADTITAGAIIVAIDTWIFTGERFHRSIAPMKAIPAMWTVAPTGAACPAFRQSDAVQPSLISMAIRIRSE